MQTDADIVLHGHLVEQPNILEGSRQAQLIGLSSVHPCRILAVDHDCSGCRLVYLGEQVENRGLSRAVGADQAGNLRFSDGQVEIVHGTQTAEINTQMAAFQHRAFSKIPLGNNGTGRERNHFRVAFPLDLLTHAAHRPSSGHFPEALNAGSSDSF